MEPTRDAAASLLDWSRVGDAGARARFRFSGALPVFIGHFPGQPLLPGVYQLAAIAETARRALGTLDVVACERAKWSAPAYPESELLVEAHWRERDGGVLVDGTVSTASGPCASCRLIMRG